MASNNTTGSFGDEKSPVTDSTVKAPLTNDPFAAQRDPVADEEPDTWDAAKTKPSRFQQRHGSIHATPASRDSHTDRNKDRDAEFHALADSMRPGILGYVMGGTRRKSAPSKEDAKDNALEKESRESGGK